MNALIVDDERLARVGLRRLLKDHTDIAIVGEARSADEACMQIRHSQPDVVFLDIEMPGRSGLELINDLEDPPAVIFTTAYESHAVRAFGVGAVDYLVKPIVPERLDVALDRLRRLVDSTKRPKSYSSRFLFRHGERYWIVPSSKIRLLESEGNYTRVHFGDAQALVCKSLSTLQGRLDPNIFFRASRSKIINLQDIKTLESQPCGALLATLADGTKVVFSRRQARLLGRWLTF